MSKAYQDYLSFKAEYPTAIVLYRMGDFFEAFGADAVYLHEELSLTLTTRHLSRTEAVEMAGVPHHAIVTYRERLVKLGNVVIVVDYHDLNYVERGLRLRDVSQECYPVIHPDGDYFLRFVDKELRIFKDMQPLPPLMLEYPAKLLLDIVENAMDLLFMDQTATDPLNDKRAYIADCIEWVNLYHDLPETLKSKFAFWGDLKPEDADAAVIRAAVGSQEEE